jgi:hypothetical protein
VRPGADSEPGTAHPDTVIVDALTAFFNRESEPSGADAVELMCALIAASGRPLLTETWPVQADVEEDRYGIATATVHVGPYTVRVGQPADGGGDLRVEVVSDDGDDYGLAIAVNGRAVLDPMTFTWTSSVPRDLQLTKEVHRR